MSAARAAEPPPWNSLARPLTSDSRLSRALAVPSELNPPKDNYGVEPSKASPALYALVLIATTRAWTITSIPLSVICDRTDRAPPGLSIHVRPPWIADTRTAPHDRSHKRLLHCHASISVPSTITESVGTSPLPEMRSLTTRSVKRIMKEDRKPARDRLTGFLHAPNPTYAAHLGPKS